MRPTFGFRGKEMMFEPNDAVAASMLQAFALEAVAAHEPRIKINSTNVKRVNNELKLSLDLSFTSGSKTVFDYTLSLNPQ